MIISHFVTQQDADLKVNPLSSVPATLSILSGPRCWETDTDAAVTWRFMTCSIVKVVDGNVFMDQGQGFTADAHAVIN